MVFPDVTDFSGAYALGLIWGTASYTPGQFLIRHRELEIVEKIKKALDLPMQTTALSQRTGPQFRVKVSAAADAGALLGWLEPLGWAPRNSDERPYPDHAGLDDCGFISAWARLHSSADAAKARWSRDGRIPRIRIYGNYALMSRMSEVISEQAGLPAMKPQKTANEITKILYYQGASAVALGKWLAMKDDINT
jgi:hypothetical protein